MKQTAFFPPRLLLPFAFALLLLSPCAARALDAKLFLQNIRADDSDAVAAQIAADPGYATWHDATGNTWLHIAMAEKISPRMMKVLLKATPDCNTRNKYGLTPLHQLIDQRFLIRYAPVVSGNYRGKTPPDDPVYRWIATDPPMLNANLNIDLDGVRELLKAGTDLDATDGANNTPVLLAVMLDSPALVQLFNEFPYDPKLANSTNNSAMDLAIQSNDAILVHALIEKGVDINAVSPYYGSAWEGALGSRSFPMVLDMLNHGADPNAVFGNSFQPLHRTVMWCGESDDGTKIMKLLIDRGANVNAPDGRGWTPLFYAAYQSPESLELLLNHGATVDFRDATGATPLYFLAGLRGGWSANWPKNYRMLLDHGADPFTAGPGVSVLDSVAGLFFGSPYDYMSSMRMRRDWYFIFHVRWDEDNRAMFRLVYQSCQPPPTALWLGLALSSLVLLTLFRHRLDRRLTPAQSLLPAAAATVSNSAKPFQSVPPDVQVARFRAARAFAPLSLFAWLLFIILSRLDPLLAAASKLELWVPLICLWLSFLPLSVLYAEKAKHLRWATWASALLGFAGCLWTLYHALAFYLLLRDEAMVTALLLLSLMHLIWCVRALTTIRQAGRLRAAARTLATRAAATAAAADTGLPNLPGTWDESAPRPPS